MLVYKYIYLMSMYLCEYIGSATLNEGDLVTFGHPRGQMLSPGTWHRQPDSDFQYIVSPLCNLYSYMSA